MDDTEALGVVPQTVDLDAPVHRVEQRTRTLRALVRAFPPVLVVAVLFGAIYFATFRHSVPLETRVNAVAFADASDYVTLLTDSYYLTLLRTPTASLKPASPDEELQRKTLHHIAYLLVADAETHLWRALGIESSLTALWLTSPVLGSLNVLMMFSLLRRMPASSPLAWPGALAYAVLPATWIYASMPESWIFSGTAVLLILHARDRRLSAWLIGIMIGTLALANFLLLLSCALFWDRRFWRSSALLSVTAAATWISLLTVLGLTLSADFLPLRFFALTIAFKHSFPENLSLVDPARWAYHSINSWVAPFVLNQRDLIPGRFALQATLRTVPLGTLSVATLLTFLYFPARALLRSLRLGSDGATKIRDALSGEWIYLGVVFVATGVALYYESLLFSPMICPVVLALGLGALPRSALTVRCAWAVCFVWSLNAVQQISTFRAGLGLP